MNVLTQDCVFGCGQSFQSELEYTKHCANCPVVWGLEKPKYEEIKENKETKENDENILLSYSQSTELKSDDDDGPNQITNIKPTKMEVSSIDNENKELILTYYYEANQYYFLVKCHKPFAQGYFKNAYKATMISKHRKNNKSPNIADGTNCVLKVLKTGAILERKGWDKDVKELKNLKKYCEEWNKLRFSNKSYYSAESCILKVSSQGNGDNNGTIFKKGEYVMVEPLLPSFDKWNWPNKSVKEAKALSVQAFSHFTYHYSNGKEMVTDAQGYRDSDQYILTDPYFLFSNQHSKHIRLWFQDHHCNKWCKSWWKTPISVKRKKLNHNRYIGNKNNKNNQVRPTTFDL